jgi:NADH:quinone reductase (non-electrogenic)
VILGEVAAIDRVGRRVILTDGEVGYDYLVVAAGSASSYFGHEAWRTWAPPLLSLEEALEIRRRLLIAFEQAERSSDAPARAALLTFVVVGGGPTGVEMAGAIAEMARFTLARDFRNIDPRSARVVLVEGADRVMPVFPPDLSRKAFASLSRLGVEVMTGVRVTGVDQDGIDLEGTRLPARSVIWAAGVAASPLVRSLGAELDRAGRVLVNADLSLPGQPEMFVVGDCAAVAWRDGKVPGLAPAAIQEGRHAARNILRLMSGRSTVPFRYLDRGTLATIGRAAAVADFGRVRLSGYVAWWAWLLIHIFFLIGFRNRFLVLFEWAWAYWTYDRGARLVTGDAAAASGRTKPAS